MAQPPETSLLSMDESPMREKIVDFCADGKQGYRTLLNLRETCKTTKQWVDDNLSAVITRRIFLESLVRIEATRDNLLSFMQSSFSKISIPNLYFDLRRDSFDLDLTNNEEDKELLENFFDLWRPRVESLELNYCTYPPALPDDDITTAPNLTSFQCHHLYAERHEDAKRLFGHFPFEVERLSITHLDLGPEHKKEFYRNLSLNSGNLKYFGTAPLYNDANWVTIFVSRYPDDFLDTMKCLCDLIDAKGYDPDFTMVLNFKGFPGPAQAQDPRHIQALVKLFQEIVESQFTIRLYSFPEEHIFLFEMMNDGDLKADGVFVDEVEALCDQIYSLPYLINCGSLLQKYSFPSLTKIGLVVPLPESQELTGETAAFLAAPDLRSLPNLSQLGVFGSKDRPPNWPLLLVPTLRKLSIFQEGVDSLRGIATGLNAIVEFCPGLKSLEMNYRVEDIKDFTDNSIENEISLQKTAIQSVSLHVDCTKNDLVPPLALVFCKSVRDLPLQKLNLRFPPPAQESGDQGLLYAMNEHRVSLLQTPPILENLIELTVNEDCVDGPGLVLLNELKTYVEGNKLRLRLTPGTATATDELKRTKRIFSLEEDVQRLI